MTDRRELVALLTGPPRPLSFLESARVIGLLRRVELLAFSRLGRVAVDGTLAPSQAVASFAASMGHARRADALSSLLPVSTMPAGGEQSPSPLDDRAGATLDELIASADRERADLYGVLEQAYRARLSHTEEHSDGAAARVLRRLADDVAVTQLQHAFCQGDPAGEA